MSHKRDYFNYFYKINLLYYCLKYVNVCDIKEIILIIFIRSIFYIIDLNIFWMDIKINRPIISDLCKVKRQYLFTLQVSRYRLLALKSSASLFLGGAAGRGAAYRMISV